MGGYLIFFIGMSPAVGQFYTAFLLQRTHILLVYFGLECNCTYILCDYAGSCYVHTTWVLLSAHTEFNMTDYFLIHDIPEVEEKGMVNAFKKDYWKFASVRYRADYILEAFQEVFDRDAGVVLDMNRNGTDFKLDVTFGIAPSPGVNMLPPAKSPRLPVSALDAFQPIVKLFIRLHARQYYYEETNMEHLMRLFTSADHSKNALFLCQTVPHKIRDAEKAEKAAYKDAVNLCEAFEKILLDKGPALFGPCAQHTTGSAILKHMSDVIAQTDRCPNKRKNRSSDEHQAPYQCPAAPKRRRADHKTEAKRTPSRRRNTASTAADEAMQPPPPSPPPVQEEKKQRRPRLKVPKNPGKPKPARAGTQREPAAAGGGGAFVLPGVAPPSNKTVIKQTQTEPMEALEAHPVISSKYKRIRPANASGQWSTGFFAESVQTKKTVFLKVEFQTRGVAYRLLHTENPILDHLATTSAAKHCVKKLDYFDYVPPPHEHNYAHYYFEVLVLECYSKTLRELLAEEAWAQTDEKTRHAVAKAVANCCIPVFTELGKYGTAYVDVNDANIMFVDPDPLQTKNFSCRLIDFGLSTGNHHSMKLYLAYPPKEGVEGTTKFASLWMHTCYPASTYDDFEQLGYLIWFILQGLPWENIKGDNHKRVAAAKNSARERAPVAVKAYLEYFQVSGVNTPESVGKSEAGATRHYEFHADRAARGCKLLKL